MRNYNAPRYGFNGSCRKAGGSIKSDARAKYDDKKLGKMGAASSCRRIDPETGEVTEIVSTNSGKKKSRQKKDASAQRFAAMAIKSKRDKRKGNSLANYADRIMMMESQKSPLLRTSEKLRDG